MSPIPEIDEQSLTELFLWLVQHNAPSGQEAGLAALLAERLAGLGFTVSTDNAGATFGGNSGNVIGYRPGRGGRHFLFMAHMDTVAPTVDIRPSVQDGVVVTDGRTILGADDRAGIAAVLAGVAAWGQSQPGDLTVVFSVGEEVGLYGAKALDVPRLGAALGFVLDAGAAPGTIVVQAPYEEELDITVYGKAAHAGVEPERGINAIQVAARALSAVPMGRLDSATTANAGLIKGGVATNIVPDRVEIRAEIRSQRFDRLQEELSRWQTIFAQTASEAGARVEISHTLDYQGFTLDPSHPAVQLAARAASRVGLAPVFQSRGGGSDTNILNARGLPAVNLGVGVVGEHTHDEHIKIADLAATARWVAAIMAEA